MGAQSHSSVRSKLILSMFGTLLLVVASTLAGVVWMTESAMREQQNDLEKQILNNLDEKGTVLAASHAVALGPLVVDNAFADINKLVVNTVRGDQDILYGLFLSPEQKPWAYVSPNHQAKEGEPPDLEAWKELKIRDPKSAQREVELFSQRVHEFTSTVELEGEFLGTIRYGISDARLQGTLAHSREEVARLRTLLIKFFTAMGIGVLFFGVLLMTRVARNLTIPLGALTQAAKLITKGDRSQRVDVKTNDEMKVLAGAFNEMLEESEKQFRELEEKTEQALAASRLKSEFLANMSHEIRTPMNGVLGMIKLLQRQPLEPRARRYSDTIEASAHALMTIINDILDFSKMEAGKYQLQQASFDARIVVQEVSELLGTRALERGVELVYRIDPEFPALLSGDPDRFRQILNNLVGNAVKFTDEGEVFINMRAEETDSEKVQCIVEVADSGIGIPEAALSALFDAFSQADGSMVRKHGGTGLGLTISQHLAGLMGGEITVESQEGVGSKFTVSLLLDPQPSEPSRRNTDWTQGKKIAVIEPSERWASVLKEHLTAWNLECEVFSDPKEGLAALRGAQSEFDVILFGLQLKEPRVREFIKEVRADQVLAATPIIALTHLGSSATLSEVERDLAAQVSKPLRASELFNAIQGTLIARTPDLSEGKTAQPKARKTKRPVLVVDDNEINQVVAVEELEYSGYATEVASDGAEALEKAKSGNYLLILMDCQMPVMDGYTATRKIREFEEKTGKRTPIIALTAHALGGEREKVLKAGMDDYLSKPFRPDSLRKLLKRHQITESTEQPNTATQETKGSAQNELDPNVRRSKRVIQLCLDNMPDQLAKLRDAFEAGDCPEVRAQAHKLKGSCLAAGAKPMAAAAETLQQQSEQGDLSSAVPLLSELERRFGVVQLLLKEEASAEG